MQITKIVSTGPALNAAADATDFSVDRDVVNGEFYTWVNIERPRIGSVVRAWEVTLDEAVALVEECPNDPAGTAWSQRMRAVIARARIDVVRPFDRVTFDAADHDLTAKIEAYADGLRRTSPLLACVADTVEDVVACYDSVGDLLGRLGRFTESGVLVEPVDSGSDEDWYDAEDPEEPRRTLVPWMHVDLLRTANGPGFYGTRQEVQALLDAIRDRLPEIGEFDNAKARSGA